MYGKTINNTLTCEMLVLCKPLKTLTKKAFVQLLADETKTWMKHASHACHKRVE